MPFKFDAERSKMASGPYRLQTAGTWSIPVQRSFPSIWKPVLSLRGAFGEAVGQLPAREGRPHGRLPLAYPKAARAQAENSAPLALALPTRTCVRLMKIFSLNYISFLRH